MDNSKQISTLMGELKSSSVIRSLIPMGYVASLPILSIKNDNLCVTIPFLRYKITGETDKTLVFPIRYLIEYSLPQKQVIQFKDLYYDQAFAKVDFAKACGLFRHDAVKNLNREQYINLKSSTLRDYDKVVQFLIDDSDYSIDDEKLMIQHLSTIIEPSLIPMYRFINSEFYNKYLNSANHEQD